MQSFLELVRPLACIALVLLATEIQAAELSRAEIGKLGKAATAFVVLPDKSTGTGFCVHASGLFVTNEHVIHGHESAEIKVVLDSSLKTERVLTAKVVRVDADEDLALLQVETDKELPTLSLGSDDGLTELADVIAFGFPLGAALAVAEESPAISVNAGSISALRLKGNELHFLQIDVSVTFGNSGGPVLDNSGKVIGVIVAGVAGQRGINLAIPSRQLLRFLQAPEIQFTPPALDLKTIERSLEFSAKAVTVLPGSKAPELQLILQAGDERPRSFAMQERQGVYSVTAAPVAARSDTLVEATVQFDPGSVSGLMDSLEVTLGKKSFKLKELRRIELKPKPHVVLLDDTVLTGEISGLRPAEIQLGQQKLTVDLAKAARILLAPRGTVSAVTATIVASLDDKEVARVSRRIEVGGVSGGSTGWMLLGGKHPFPASFSRSDNAQPGQEGLVFADRDYVRTVKGDFLNRDFRFETVYTLKAGTTKGILFVGLGEGAPARAYREPDQSVFLKIHPPNVGDGEVLLANAPARSTHAVGKISKEGTHRVVLEKKGNALTLSIDVGNNGPSADDLQSTVPDVRKYGPFLGKSNTHLFFGGGPGGSFHQMRLSELQE
jgi:hypothetical protein